MNGHYRIVYFLIEYNIFPIDIVTIQPVRSKSKPSTASSIDAQTHSATITPLPTTYVATSTPGFVLVPHPVSAANSTPIIAASNILQSQPTLAYSFPTVSTSDVSQALLAGGHIIKQDGRR